LKKIKFILFLIIILNTQFSVSQESYKNGRPFIKVYNDVEEFAYNQIWDIVQDKRGVMYFGTTSGIIEFDGSKWHLISVSNNSGVRSLDIDSIGRIYVGATGEFGYLACDSIGEIRYYSLKPLIDSLHNVFTDVWKVKVTSTGVYFVTLHCVYRWYQDKISILVSDSENYYGFEQNKSLMLFNRKKGMFKVDKDTLLKLPFTKYLIPERGLVSILPFKENKLLFLTNNKIWLYNYDLIEHYSEKYAAEIDSNLFINQFKTNFLDYLKENRIYSEININDSLFAIGTMRGGVLFFNSKGEFLNKLDKTDGLPDNTILSLYLDSFNDLWVGTNSGIVRIEINSPVTYFDDKDGIEGSILSFSFYQNELYVGTMNGIYKMIEKSQNHLKKEKFELISEHKASCWDFYEYKNILFTSGYDGLAIIKQNKVQEKIKTPPVFCFGQTRKFPNHIFIGMTNSFGYFQVKDSLNSSMPSIGYFKKLDKINETIRLITSDKNDNLWITSEYQGIYNIEFKNDNIDNYIVTNYDTTDGLPQMDFNYVFNIEDKILVGTSKGLYQVIKSENSAKPYRIIPDSSYGKVFADENNYIGDIAKDKNDNLWISASFGMGPVYKTKNNTFIWDTIPFIKAESYTLNFPNKDVLWSNSSKKIYRYDLNTKYDFYNAFNAFIKKVIVGKDSILMSGSFYNSKISFENKNYLPGLNQPNSLKPEIKYKNNSLTFYFSAANYFDSKKLYYSFILKGFDKEWSNWIDENKKEYTNLPEGEYEFIVKAKDLYSQISRESKYTFTILPPWYRTIYSYFAYLIIISFIFYLVITLNTQRLKAANLKLERIVKERTAEIEKQKENILERNAEIIEQKEEIAKQAKQLEITNIELEKLSIVASKTDNAVVIMDAHGKFLWINEGFKRMYGFSFEEMIKERGDNIFDTSSNVYVKDLIHTCVKEKKTVIYESMIISRQGNKIWAQTTLTPIIDDYGNVSKLIAIDTDIGQLKTAEIEISNQKEELQAQSEMLSEINNELEKTNILITDSISYAQRIQEAILPSEDIIKNYFSESFVFFKPKDIVSGDFFWFLKPETDEWEKANNKVFFAAVDCTGHGVPGAFMSMIGNTLLNDIVGKEKIFKPSEILSKLNSGIINLLSQSKNSGDSQDDGMDITICKFDPDMEELEIALANHTAYISKNGELTSIEGDIFSIGGFFAKRFKPKFKDHIIETNEDTILYLFSDGYKDQFGGKNKQKFIETRFKKMFEDNMHKSMAEQYKIVEQTFTNWKGINKQIDDVMVIGIKFTDLKYED